jgi:uDENN domain/Putative GTPase activating protein for Arf
MNKISLEMDALSWRPESVSTSAPMFSTSSQGVEMGHHDNYINNTTPQPQHPSIPKIMTQLLAVPTNRSCADCKSALVDTSQIYASYSPNVTGTPSLKGNNGDGNDQNPFNDIPTTRKSNSKKKHFDNNTKTFQQNHKAFMPLFPDVVTSTANEVGIFHHVAKIPALQESVDMMVDPAITATSICYHSHGVFVCALCGAAHKLLKRTTTIVKSVMDVSSWMDDESSNDIYILMNAGGNTRANAILEAYYNVPNNANSSNNSITIPRPTSTSTIVDRLIFIRAKYEALAFLLPSSSAVSKSAWQNILNLHPEWDGLWGANLRQQISDVDYLQQQSDTNNTAHTNSVWQPANGSAKTPTTNNNSTHSKKALSTTTTTSLPNRLIDYFCVVTASEFLHPSMFQQDLSSISTSPEDILLTPTVTDCIPLPDSYNYNNVDEAMACENNTFPEHISTFVYPDGCTPALVQLPPLFFTVVLTNSSGERLYGGILRLYDDNYDTTETISNILQKSKYPLRQYPLWVPKSYRSTSLPAGQQKQRPGSTKMKIVKSNKDITSTAIQATTTTSDVMFLPKSLVVISHYPFFDIFRKFLLQIYRIALTEAPLPIERFVTNFGSFSFFSRVERYYISLTSLFEFFFPEY